MLIGSLAERTGVTAKTLRFYEGRGLLPEPDRSAAGYRCYDEGAVERVTFIRDAQAAGFTLAQIGEVLAIRDDGRPACEHVTALVGQRLAEVEERLRELREVRKRLRDLAEVATTVDPASCDGYCEIVSDAGR